MIKVLKYGNTLVLDRQEVEERIMELRELSEKYRGVEHETQTSIWCGMADQLEEILDSAVETIEVRFGGSFRELDDAADVLMNLGVR